MWNLHRIWKSRLATRKAMIALIMFAAIFPGALYGFERAQGNREVAAESIGDSRLRGKERFDFYLPPSLRDRSYEWGGDRLSWQHGPTLQLRTPDAFPGIELGIESYSFGSFHWFTPPDRLPRGYDFDLRDYMPAKPFDSMDHTGAVLRFTW